MATPKDQMTPRTRQLNEIRKKRLEYYEAKNRKNDDETISAKETKATHKMTNQLAECQPAKKSNDQEIALSLQYDEIINGFPLKKDRLCQEQNDMSENTQKKYGSVKEEDSKPSQTNGDSVTENTKAFRPDNNGRSGFRNIDFRNLSLVLGEEKLSRLLHNLEDDDDEVSSSDQRNVRSSSTPNESATLKTTGEKRKTPVLKELSPFVSSSSLTASPRVSTNHSRVLKFDVQFRESRQSVAESVDLGLETHRPSVAQTKELGFLNPRDSVYQFNEATDSSSGLTTESVSLETADVANVTYCYSVGEIYAQANALNFTDFDDTAKVATQNSSKELINGKDNSDPRSPESSYEFESVSVTSKQTTDEKAIDIVVNSSSYKSSLEKLGSENKGRVSSSKDSSLQQPDTVRSEHSIGRSVTNGKTSYSSPLAFQQEIKMLSKNVHGINAEAANGDLPVKVQPADTVSQLTHKTPGATKYDEDSRQKEAGDRREVSSSKSSDLALPPALQRYFMSLQLLEETPASSIVDFEPVPSPHIEETPRNMRGLSIAGSPVVSSTKVVKTRTSQGKPELIDKVRGSPRLRKYPKDLVGSKSSVSSSVKSTSNVLASVESLKHSKDISENNEGIKSAPQTKQDRDEMQVKKHTTPGKSQEQMGHSRNLSFSSLSSSSSESFSSVTSLSQTTGHKGDRSVTGVSKVDKKEDENVSPQNETAVYSNNEEDLYALVQFALSEIDSSQPGAIEAKLTSLGIDFEFLRSSQDTATSLTSALSRSHDVKTSAYETNEGAGTVNVRVMVQKIAAESVEDASRSSDQVNNKHSDVESSSNERNGVHQRNTRNKPVPKKYYNSASNVGQLSPISDKTEAESKTARVCPNCKAVVSAPTSSICVECGLGALRPVNDGPVRSGASPRVSSSANVRKQRRAGGGGVSAAAVRSKNTTLDATLRSELTLPLGSVNSSLRSSTLSSNTGSVVKGSVNSSLSIDYVNTLRATLPRDLREQLSIDVRGSSDSTLTVSVSKSRRTGVQDIRVSDDTTSQSTPTQRSERDSDNETFRSSGSITEKTKHSSEGAKFRDSKQDKDEKDGERSARSSKDLKRVIARSRQHHKLNSARSDQQIRQNSETLGHENRGENQAENHRENNDDVQEIEDVLSDNDSVETLEVREEENGRLVGGEWEVMSEESITPMDDQTTQTEPESRPEPLSISGVKAVPRPGSSQGRPHLSGSKQFAGVESKVRQSWEAKPPARRWEKSSLAWSTFKSRELLKPPGTGLPAAKSTPLRPGSAGRVRPISASVSHSQAPPSRQRPRSADYSRRSAPGGVRMPEDLDDNHSDALEAVPEQVAPELRPQRSQPARASMPAPQRSHTPDSGVSRSQNMRMFKKFLSLAQGYTGKLYDVEEIEEQQWKHNQALLMSPRVRAGEASMLLCLPDELTLLILSLLPRRDLARTVQTCSHLHRVGSDLSLWRSVTVRRSERVCDAWLEEIGRRQPRELQLVHCQGHRVTAAGLRALFRQCATSLETLNICGCSGGQLTGDSVLLHVAARCTNITAVDASWCNVSDEGLAGMAEASNRLVSVSVSGCQQLTDAAVHALVAKHGSSLETLELFGCFNVTSSTAESIAQHCTKLHTLNLGQCWKLSEASLAHLAPHLSDLTNLDLRGVKQLTDGGVHHVVRHCTRLRTLSLANCPALTDTSLAEIATYCPNIQSLDVCGCKQLSNVGVRALTSCTQLQYLDLSSTQVTSQGVGSLASYCYESLHVLKLNYCKTLSMTALTRLVRHCKLLQKLYLYGVRGLGPVQQLRSLNPDLIIETDAERISQSFS